MSFDLDAAVARIQRDNLSYDRQCEQRRQRARIEAERLAEVLHAADPSLTHVWGFGSVFEKNRPFRPDSDLDLALEGGDFLRLQTLVGDSEFLVELIDITEATDPFARHIRNIGVLLGVRLNKG